VNTFVKKRPIEQEKLHKYLSNIADMVSPGIKGSTLYTFNDMGTIYLIFSDHKTMGVEDEVHLLLINVDGEHNKGIGQCLLDVLLVGADLYGVTLTLTPMIVETQMRIRRLIAWYKRNNFTKDSPTLMIRFPENRFNSWSLLDESFDTWFPS